MLLGKNKNAESVSVVSVLQISPEPRIQLHGSCCVIGWGFLGRHFRQADWAVSRMRSGLLLLGPQGINLPEHGQPLLSPLLRGNQGHELHALLLGSEEAKVQFSQQG